MHGTIRTFFLLGFLSTAFIRDGLADPRRPRGIYTVVDIDTQINQQQNANPNITTAQLHAFLQNYYASLLENPAISGFTLQVGWGRLNPNAPPSFQAYD